VKEKEFATSKLVKDKVTRVSVEQRRQLFLKKNDKLRVRVVCKGQVPDFANNDMGSVIPFTGDQNGPISSNYITTCNHIMEPQPATTTSMLHRRLLSQLFLNLNPCQGIAKTQHSSRSSSLVVMTSSSSSSSVSAGNSSYISDDTGYHR
ncbi:hypothetical protein Tco_1558241, partial [Tanacetum coccineum]